jgi:hypothetical protein
MTLFLIAIVVFGVAHAAPASSRGWPFDPAMVELVDAGNNTWLFRVGGSVLVHPRLIAEILGPLPAVHER